jgi:predicted DNA-binding transcriptional regulator YafY
MNVKNSVRLFGILPSSPDKALTTNEISQKWGEQSADWDEDGDEDEASRLRKIQRYVQTCQRESWVEMRVSGGQKKYYLNKNQVSDWMMSEENALVLQITRQIYDRTLGFGDDERAAGMAEQVASQALSLAARRMRDCFRVVPDGIGRLSARIAPDVLKEAMRAIRTNRMFQFDYTNQKGKPSNIQCSPLGLVAKDGTIYLVATQGLADPPRHYALHRMKSADALPNPAQPRPDFDLDRHIENTHQFSHALNNDPTPIELKLRVAPEGMFHFTERPLSTNQTVTPPAETGGWHTVTATIPKTMLLRPFLASMGPYIEVLGPQELRAELAQWSRGMSDLYRGDEDL